MSDDKQELSGPDLSQGVALTAIADGAMLLGYVGEEPVLLARQGDEFFAIGALCTHYQGPLAEGLFEDTVRYPWLRHCICVAGRAEKEQPRVRQSSHLGNVG